MLLTPYDGKTEKGEEDGHMLALPPSPLRNYLWFPLLQQQQHCTYIKVCPQYGKPRSWTCVGLYYTTRSVKLSQQRGPFLPHPGKQDCPEAVRKNRSGEVVWVHTQRRDKFPCSRRSSSKSLPFLLLLRGHAC